MPELSADAKKELAEAIRIVREDKQFSMLRDIHSRGTATPPPQNQPPTGTPGTQPPPANPPAGDPPPEAVRKDAYWGELLS